jgi:hypothetical protein
LISAAAGGSLAQEAGYMQVPPPVPLVRTAPLPLPLGL